MKLLISMALTLLIDLSCICFRFFKAISLKNCISKYRLAVIKINFCPFLYGYLLLFLLFLFFSSINQFDHENRIDRVKRNFAILISFYY